MSVIPREVLGRHDGRRKLANAMMLAALYTLAIIAVTPLLAVFVYVLQKGFGGLTWEFFTELPKPVGESGGGMLNAIAGSAVLVGLASLVGIPWGIAAGVYLSEYGRGKLARGLRLTTDLLTSVPSIVVGLFAYAVIVIPMGGFSAYAGGAALAVMMIPVVTKSTEEILKLVPTHIREAGLALGLPRWRVITSIVLRGSVKGLLTGVILSVARIAGETAPLLFTAFNNQFWPQGLRQPTPSLPVQIYTYAISPFEEWHNQAWAGALFLILFVFALNITTRLIFARKS